MSAREARWALRAVGTGASAELPDSGALVVGSSPDRAGLRIEGPDVAATHFAVGRLKGGGWAVRDLGSPAGTRLNGEPVASGRLRPGDRLEAGGAAVLVVDLDAEAAACAEAPAARIGGYRIERPLGRGAMGQVVLAVQENLDRRVALKILPPKLAADAEFLRRFQSEARAAAALSHPNVVVVYDVGHADEHYYLAMELMEGGNLEERVARDGPLPWREVLDVLCDATAGLVFAETQRILHRDIKPANLMQTGTGTTKIADLGLATGLDESDAGERRIFGTPHFMAPEQARGDAVDHRADLYALGATAFRLLTGRTPFEGETTRDILRAKLTGDPPSVRSIVPGVPVELDRIVSALLKREPALRTPSAAALASDLEALRVRVQAAEVRAPGGARRTAAAALAVVAAGTALYFLLPGAAADGEAPPQPAPRAFAPREAAASELLPELPEADVESGPELDEDRLLSALEAEAERALAGVRLDPEEEAEPRIDALESLARRYAGTDAAVRAVAEAQGLRAALAARESRVDAQAELAARIRAELAPLTAASDEPLAARLAALAGHVPPGTLADEPRFRSARASAEVTLVNEEIELLGAGLAAAEELALTGDFDAYRDRLRALVARLPEEPAEGSGDPDAAEPGDGGAPTGDAPAGGAPAEGEPARAPAVGGLVLPEDATDELRGAALRLAAVAAEVREALAGAAERERAHWEALRREDARRVAGAMRGAQGIDAHLAEGDYARAAESVATLAAAVNLDETRDRLADLREALRAGEGALAALARTHESGGWRRHSIADPRSSRSTAADIARVDDEGLTLDVRGELERLPWSAFLAAPDDVHGLFYNRLERSWTAEERDGIAVLARVAAVLRARTRLGAMLERPPAAESVREAQQELERAFDTAFEWAAGTSAEEAVEREREAMRRLARVVAHIALESWPDAVAGLEGLLGEYGDTLLVALLSDGAPWRAPEPRPDPAGPASAEAEDA